MYCSHFGLHRPPFNNTPDPTFYYSTPEHEEALATLQYATLERKGFVLVTGDIGAGKTLVGRMFVRQMDRTASVAVINHTNLSGRQLLAAICAEFNLETPPDANNLQLTERLQGYLLEEFARDRFAVVLVDEAQNLPDESFEELRMLGNLEADDAKLLQVCILGQPELRDRIRHPNLRQLQQRLFRRFHLHSLDRANTEAYIRHRVQVAGCEREDLFTSEAIDMVYKASQGTPRLINQYCDNALLAAYSDGETQVTDKIMAASLEAEESEPESAPRYPQPSFDLGYGDPNSPSSTPTLPPSELMFDSVPTVSSTVSQSASIEIEPIEDMLMPENQPAIESAETAEQVVESHARHESMVVDDDLDDASDETDDEFANPAAVDYDTLAAVEANASPATDDPTTEPEAPETVSHPGPSAELVEQHGRSITEHDRAIQDQAQAVGRHDQALGRHDRTIRHQGKALKQQGQAINDHARSLDEHGRVINQHGRSLQQQGRAINQVQSEGRRHAMVTVQTREKVRAIADQTNQRWQTMNEKLERARADLMAKVSQSSEQVQIIRERIEHLGRAAVGQRDVEQIRESYRLETERLQRNIEDQRREVAKLISEAEQRWQDTQAKAAAMVDDPARQEELDKLEAAFEDRLDDIVAHVDNHREQITRLTQVLRDHGQQTQRELQQLAKAQEEAERKRQEDLAQTRQELEHRLSDHESKFSEFDERVTRFADQTREALARLENDSATDEALSTLRQEQQHQAAELMRQFSDQVKALVAFKKEVDDRSAASEGQTQSALTEISSHIARQARRVQKLRRKMSEQLDTLRGEQEQRFAQLQKAQQGLAVQLRSEYSRSASELRGDQEATAEQLRHEQHEIASTLRDEHRKDVESLRTQQEQGDDSLRHEHHKDVTELREAHAETARALREAHAADVERLDNLSREHQDAIARLSQTSQSRADEILAKVESNRTAVRNMLTGVVGRFEATHKRIEALATDKASVEELKALRAQHQHDAAALTEQLNTYRSSVEQECDQLAQRLQATGQELEALGNRAADKSAVDEFKRRNDQQHAEVLTSLSSQREDLETLCGGINQRCDDLSRRLDDLPEDIATVGGLQALSDELHEFTARAASHEDVQTLRGDHETLRGDHESLRGDHETLRGDHESLRGDHETLRGNHESLRGDHETLRGNHESLRGDHETLREDHTARLRALLGQLDQHAKQHDRDVNVLVRQVKKQADHLDAHSGQLDKHRNVLDGHQVVLKKQGHALHKHESVLKSHDDRVTHLETMERPKPIQLELTPKEGRQLGDVVVAARQEQEQLADATDRAGAIAAHLNNVSNSVQETMQHWAENADQVAEQSQRLRNSAEMAGRILEAMRKCHTALDKKLNSQRWNAELARGEALAERMEQATAKANATVDRLHAAMRDYDSCQDFSDEWSQRKREVAEATDRLAQLMRDANVLSQALGKRKEVLNAIAARTNGLIDLVKSAGLADEEQRPAGGTGTNGGHSNRGGTRLGNQRVADVNWPRFRTHPATVGVG